MRSLMLSLPMLLLMVMLWTPREVAGCIPQQLQQQQLLMQEPSDSGQRQLSEDFPYQEEQIFNLTTIGPDDETLDTLVAAADAAAQSIEDFIAGGGGVNEVTSEGGDKYDDTGGGDGGDIGNDNTDNGATVDDDGDDGVGGHDSFDTEHSVPSTVAADTVADEIPKEEEEYYDTYDFNFNETEYYYTDDGSGGSYEEEEGGSGTDNDGEDVVEDNETINIDSDGYRPHKNRTVRGLFVETLTSRCPCPTVFVTD